MALSRLVLTDFRNHAEALLEPGPGLVVLTGENGAGKTNILEAVSLLSPGRGLRGATLGEMARTGGSGGFAVAARLGDVEIGTGTDARAPERRQVRINGAAASATSLSEWLSVLWLTPAMDRLFQEGAGGRRRFLDRLVLALEPGHAVHAARYEAAMRARNKLLAEDGPRDEAWLSALEARMAEHGAALAEARSRTVALLGDRLAVGARKPVRPGRPGARRRRRGSVARARPRPSPATPPPAGPSPARTEPTSPSPISAKARPRASARPASRRRCCSRSSSPMPISSPTAPAAARSSSSTRSPPTSTRAAAPLCSSGSPRAAARSG